MPPPARAKRESGRVRPERKGRHGVSGAVGAQWVRGVCRVSAAAAAGCAVRVGNGGVAGGTFAPVCRGGANGRTFAGVGSARVGVASQPKGGNKMKQKSVLGTGLALLLMTAGVWAGPPRAHLARASSAWTVNPALVAQLGPEVKLSAPGVGTYGIRPPRGFTLRQINMTAIAGAGMIYMWMGPMQADKTAANFTVTLGNDNSGMMPGMTSASFMRLEMSSMTRTHLNAQVSPPPSRGRSTGCRLPVPCGKASGRARARCLTASFTGSSCAR